MHRIVFSWRVLAPAAALAALIAFAVVLGGGTGSPRTLAAGTTPGPTPNLTGLSCADVFVDLGNDNIPDDINGNSTFGDDGDITSLSMNRIEPHSGGGWDVTSVSYLGKDTSGDTIPDGSPGPGCHTSAKAAAGAAEDNSFGGLYSVAYGNQYGIRPTALGTYAQCIGGAPAPGCTGQPDGSGILTFSTCGFAETLSMWVRIDSTSNILKTGAGAMNTGDGVLYLGTAAPTAGAFDSNGDTVSDTTTAPTSCDPLGQDHGAGGGDDAFAYNFVSRSHSRDARSDHWAASVGACGTNDACVNNVTLGIGQDPNGPHPKVKGINNDQVIDTSDTLADDWDGDGCPDWDEMDHEYMPGTPPVALAFPPVYDWSTNPVNGLDPYNPNDCDTNWQSTISLSTVIIHNTATKCTFIQNLTGACANGNGQSFRCIGSFTDSKLKTGQSPLGFRLGCYSDSTLTVVNSSYPEVPYDGTRPEGTGQAVNTCSDTLDNDADTKIDSADSDCHVSTCPPAPAGMCGDGKAGGAPPGCVANGDTTRCASNTKVPNCATLPCPTTRYVFVGIDTDSYPVISPASGNYHDTSDNTIHLGGCFAGFGGGTFGNVYGSSVIDAHTGAGSFSIFLNQTLSDCNNGTPQGTPVNGQIEIVEWKTEKTPLPDNQKYDNDGDGCADARELLSSATMGGYRDPYNGNDYFNPEKTNTPDTQTVADILKVVQQFGKNQGNVAYTSGTDRTGVLGGESWSLGPPDGQQTVADILAAVKQFGHNCPRVTP